MGGVGVSHPQLFHAVSRFGKNILRCPLKFVALKELYSLLSKDLKNKFK